jgi:hypothetical protein
MRCEVNPNTDQCGMAIDNFVQSKERIVLFFIEQVPGEAK